VGFLIDLRDLNTAAQETLCQDACPCNYTGEDIVPGWNTTGSIIKVEDCDGFRNNSNSAEIIIM